MQVTTDGFWQTLQTTWQQFLNWGQQAASSPAVGSAVQTLGDSAQSVGGAVGSAIQNWNTGSLMALAAGLGWASGFRLYAVVFATGLAGVLHWIPLPGGLVVLQHPVVLGASGFMLFVEFFADKIPGLDSVWDLVNSVVRIPAGAALAASVFGADSGAMALAAGLLGGTLAATSQAAKTTTRAALNTSPEPVSNVAASFGEDFASMGIMWLATTQPLIFGIVASVAFVLMLVVIFFLVRYLRAAWRRGKHLFSPSESHGLASQP